MIADAVSKAEFHERSFIPLGLEVAIKVAQRVMDKHIPDAPKEVEVNGEMEMKGLPTQMVNVLVQSQSQNSSSSSEILSPSVKPSVPQIPTSNGNALSLETVGLLMKTVESTPTTGQEQSS
jgi:hypothetical protein